MSSLLVGDRRAALKARHRRAIVDAAAALIGESGGTDFSVDELAGRADVSRRTVFNHFGSLDEVVTEVCSEVVGAALDRLDAIASGESTRTATSRCSTRSPRRCARPTSSPR
ncbi:TetR/AcrR family transcriptional regulator [Oerskovia sp. M15]